MIKQQRASKRQRAMASCNGDSDDLRGRQRQQKLHGKLIFVRKRYKTRCLCANIYWRETNRRTYQFNLYPVGYEDFWIDAPYNLTFYPPNMNNQRGRNRGTGFQRKMDYRNPDFHQGIADTECQDIIEKKDFYY
ncbi:hypothetical protein M9H77_27721 [Catharanthus roseus]|uniref:Uncharacterized protein n=1 Tax=Catharanthus roseus TaxID=4058 RepID=A0ACC0AHL8_CATRO|nr:hypothetical protein M9H77_27721 [Catharanthus roseus]